METNADMDSRFGRSILVGNLVGAALLAWILFYLARCG